MMVIDKTKLINDINFNRILIFKRFELADVTDPNPDRTSSF